MYASLEGKDHWDFTQVQQEVFSFLIIEHDNLSASHWSWKVFFLLFIFLIQERCGHLELLILRLLLGHWLFLYSMWLRHKVFIHVLLTWKVFHLIEVGRVDVIITSVPTHVSCGEVEHVVLKALHCEVVEADRLFKVSSAVNGPYKCFLGEIIVVETGAWGLPSLLVLKAF